MQLSNWHFHLQEEKQNAKVLHQKTEAEKLKLKSCFCLTKMLILSWFLSFWISAIICCCLLTQFHWKNGLQLCKQWLNIFILPPSFKRAQMFTRFVNKAKIICEMKKSWIRWFIRPFLTLIFCGCTLVLLYFMNTDVHTFNLTHLFSKWKTGIEGA